MRLKNQRRWLPSLKASGESLDKVLRQCRDDKNFEASLVGKNLWRSRPTRIFWLLDVFDPFCLQKNSVELWNFLRAEIKRLPDSLFLNHYSLEMLDCLRDHQATRSMFQDGIIPLLERSASIKPHKGRVSVPVVLDASNSGVFPIASFAHFVEKPDTAAISEETPAELSKIRDLFSSDWPGSLNPEYALDLAQYVPIDGRSYELGYWAHSWLALHEWPAVTSLCCTGSIKNDGKIDKVTHFEKKIESALAKGYEFCLVPAKNLEDSIFAGNPKVIGFNHVDELSKWLQEHTGTLPSRRTIKSWLISNKKKPDNQIFSIFFDQMLEESGNPVILWKSTLGQHSCEEKCHKLAAICRAFLSYLANNGNMSIDKGKRAMNALKIICPPDIFYSLLIESLLENCLNNLPMSEIFYKEYSESLLDSSLDVISASERLKTRGTQHYLKHRNFEIIRRRYPLAISLLYRNPAEMLWLFSHLENLSEFEQKLFDALIKALKNNSKGLQDNSRMRGAEAAIMHKVHTIFSEDYLLKETDLQPDSKQLPKLYEAWKKFSARDLTEAAKLCKKLLYSKLQLAPAKEKIAAEKILQILNSENSESQKPESSKNQQLLKEPHFKPLMRAIESRVTGSCPAKISHNNDLAVYRKGCHDFVKNLLDQSEDQPETIIWFPQPAYAIYTRPQKWENKLNKFCKSYPGTGYESQVLKCKCLANWTGFMHSQDPQRNTPCNVGNCEFIMPYLAGWYSGKMPAEFVPCSKKARETCRMWQYLRQSEFTDFSGLFWIKIMPESCQTCLNSRIVKLLMYFKNSEHDCDSEIPELQRKQNISYIFANALFNKKDNQVWEKLLSEFLIEPYQVRRTAQLLIPVYMVLKETDKLTAALKKTWGMNNNSNFAVEYLKTFGLPEVGSEKNLKYFRPIQWQMSLDRQMYNTICISHLADNPEALRQFILEKIDDLPNLFLALSRLDAGIKT